MSLCSSRVYCGATAVAPLLTECLSADVPSSNCFRTSPLPSESTSPCSTSESAPEGYLVLTFNKAKEARVKTAAFANVLEPGAYDEIYEEEEEDGLNFSDCDRALSARSNYDQNSVETVLKVSPTASTASEQWPSSIADSSDPPFTGLSRLAAVATAATLGVDVARITRSQPSAPIQTSNRLSEYVRRYRYPDGDTRYDCLSCPLIEMQRNGNSRQVLKPENSNAESRASTGSFLVYNSSLPHSRGLQRRFYSGIKNPLNSSNLSRKMLRCEECGKYYRNEYSLHHHICLKRKDVWKKGDVPSELIDGQVVYFCPTCNKPFKWLGNLTRHYYVHTGQRFFKCDICQKEFFSAYQVRRHMNSHTGLRFNCEVCDKPFTCKYACAWHTRQHRAFIE